MWAPSECAKLRFVPQLVLLLRNQAASGSASLRLFDPLKKRIKRAPPVHPWRGSVARDSFEDIFNFSTFPIE